MLGNKAVLVYPEVDGDTFWSFQTVMDKYLPKGEFGLPQVSLPPLGLLGLANYLKPHYNEIVLTDRRVDPRKLEELIADADHVYIGGNIAQSDHLNEDANTILNAGKPLVVGGPVVNEHSPLRGNAILVEGEAEMVMDDVVKDLENEKYDSYHTGTFTPPEKFFVPDYSILNMNNYMSMSMQTTRGCPWDCEFCGVTKMMGHKIRTTPDDQVKETINRQYEAGSRKRIFVVDDNYIGNRKTSIGVSKAMSEQEEILGYHYKKYTQLDIGLSEDTPLMEEVRLGLRKNNFEVFFIGVETNNEAALLQTGKKINLRGEGTLKEKLDHIAEETGANPSIAMVYGFDNDTEIEPFVDFINSTNAPLAMVGLLNAIPGTKLDYRLRKEGRLRDNFTGNNSDGVTNFIPNNFSAKQAEEDYVRILQQIYSKPAYFGRVMNMLEHIQPPIKSGQVTKEEKAFLKKQFFQNGLGFLTKLMTKENAPTYMRYMPKASSIAKKRFGFNTPEYWSLIGRYLTLCAQYTHLKEHTETIAQDVATRTYEPWQLYSWQELQNSKVAGVDLLEENPLTLMEKIKMSLDNGYEFVGSRIEALSHFIEPYLKDGLKKIQEARPTVENFFDVEIRSYLQAHLKRPEILGNIDFSKVENFLKQKLETQHDYFPNMLGVYRTVTVR